MVITGANFRNLDSSPPVVTFCKFPSTVEKVMESELDTDFKPLVADIVESKSNRLTVRVPSGFLKHFGIGPVHVCVTRQTGVSGHSVAFFLGGKGYFTIIPPPSVTQLDPPPEVSWGAVTLMGKNFVGRRPKVTVDGGVVEASPIDDSRLLVILPFLSADQDHSLTVS